MANPFYKPLDRPEREEIWYCYYVPRRKTDLKLPRRIPISQVPDLTKETTKVGSAELKNNKKLNVGRILETDSKYVKLAKAGGRKNLLWYRENERRNSGPKAYEVPEWYYHDDSKEDERELSEQEKHKKYKVTYGKRSYKISQLEKPKEYERPDYMTHLEPEEMRISLGKSDRIPDRPIFGYDSFSFWRRDEVEKSDKLPSLVRKEDEKKKSAQRRSIRKETQTKKKKVKLPESKNIQMSGHRKLASSGYATKWHEKWYMEAVRK